MPRLPRVSGRSEVRRRGSRFQTTVTFILESTGSATKLRLEQTGFDSMGEMGAKFRAGADYGWGQKFLRDSLPRVIAELAARA